MSITCKNCNNIFEGKFCNNCGQAAVTHKLNFHYFLHDFANSFIQLDKGIFYTSKQLFTRPGASIREFIEGKRVKHIKPISLVIILAAIYGILYQYFEINLLVTETDDGLNANEINLLSKINDWVANHYGLTSLIAIPFYALGSFISFNKQGYNYIEHLVLNTFLSGQRLIFNIITFPFLIYYKGTEYLDTFTWVMDFGDFLLIVWGYFSFFNKLSLIKRLLFTISSYIIFMLFIAIFLSIIAGIFTWFNII